MDRIQAQCRNQNSQPLPRSPRTVHALTLHRRTVVTRDEYTAGSPRNFRPQLFAEKSLALKFGARGDQAH